MLAHRAYELARANSNTPDFFDPDQVGGIATKVLPSGVELGMGEKKTKEIGVM